MEYTGGRQSGTIEFKGASIFDTHKDWESRLEIDFDNVGICVEEDHPADVDHRVGMRCTLGCWEARGIGGGTEAPPALLAACALINASGPQSRDAEEIDTRLLAASFTSVYEYFERGAEGPLLESARSWVRCSEINDSVAKEKAVDALTYEAGTDDYPRVEVGGLTTLAGHPDLNAEMPYIAIHWSMDDQLENLEGLEVCRHLRIIELSGYGMRTLDDLSGFKELGYLFLQVGDSLESIDALGDCSLLEHLRISYAPKLENLNALKKCGRLRHVGVMDAGVVNVEALGGCTNLEELALFGQEGPEHPDRLANCTRLTDLTLVWDGLENVDFLPTFKKLETLALGSKDLRNLDVLASCTGLTTLALTCPELENVDFLANCTKLEKVKFGGPFVIGQSCTSLRNVDGLANCTGLESVDLRGCESLQSIAALKKLKEGGKLQEVLLPPHLASQS